jgi:hypothetical protein
MSDPAIFRVPAKISQSLGDVVIAWSRVEALLAEFLSFLLKADPGSMYVLNQDVACSTQLKWIKTLSESQFTNANTQENLIILFRRIDDARIERNAYVHGVWGPGAEPDTATVQTVKLGRSEIIREELVTSPDLDYLFNEITFVADELHMLGTKLGFVGG